MLHRIHRFVLTLVLVANWAAAQSDDEGAALEAAEAGRSAFDRGEFELAVEHLGRAHALVPTPTVALYRARALARLGRLAEAAEMYEAATVVDPYAEPSEAHRDAQQRAFSELAALKPRVPRLLVEIQGGASLADVTLTIDGLQVTTGKDEGEYPLNPGTHTVVAKFGGREASRTVDLPEAAAETLPFWFEPEPPPPATPPLPAPAVTARTPTPEPVGEPPDAARRSATRTVGWVALGMGGAGLAIGAVSAGVSANEASALDAEGCEDNRCYADQADDVRVHNTTLVLSNVSLIAGGIAAATGVTLLLASPSARNQRPRSVTAWIAPQSVGVGSKIRW
jgi:hypothetical protein